MKPLLEADEELKTPRGTASSPVEGEASSPTPAPSTRTRERLRAPKPQGPLSGKRTPLRRFLARATARVNRILDAIPPGRWIHSLFCPSADIHEVEIPLSRGGAGIAGIRIAFLSDLHAGSFLDGDELKALFAAVQEREPDLVCFGGDLINTRERELLLYRDALAELHPPLGVYAVPGNHDHFFGSGLGLWESFLEAHGVRVLNNDGVRIQSGASSFWLAGVDDLTEGTPDLELAIEGAAEDEPIVLLAHHPDFFFEAAAVDVDLTLSGHTHGGQVRLGKWVPLHHSKFNWIEGQHELAGSRLYVGRGVGVTFLPIRIGARAEVPILSLAPPATPGT